MPNQPEPEISLIKDPDLPWGGEFPYDRLDRKLRESGYPGLDPSATNQQVKDILFDLMAKGPISAQDRLAWDELRLLERRLLVDFLMYGFRGAQSDVWSDEVWDLPMPLHIPDFSLLADVEPAYEKILTVPSSFEAPAPIATHIEAEVQAVSPVDIGSINVNEVVILGDAYV